MTKKPTKDDVVFQVTAKISNKEYTDELGNVSRAEFKILSKELAEVLTKIFEEDFKVSERLIEQVKDILTDASRYGKRGKYTLKYINVEQETAEVTNGHE